MEGAGRACIDTRFNEILLWFVFVFSTGVWCSYLLTSMIGLLVQSPILIDWNVAARLSGTGLVKENYGVNFQKVTHYFFPNVFCAPGDGAFTSSSLSLNRPF